MKKSTLKNMTTITIMKSKNGEYKRVTCEGHAGYADAGEDIVCSAISILVINTINSLDVLTDVQMEVTSDQEKGLIDCRLIGNSDLSSTLLIDSMVLGLQNVVSQYGKQYLKLKFKEV
ncbi:MAG: ribosomal-processing cysteine protease Prp [Suilimivivens sp.]|nr:ribosomal-processing cysteine protease Prp [Lachnospiraceae bacterium]